MTEGAYGEVAMSEVTVTQAVVAVAAAHAGSALVDLGFGGRLPHAEFAALVPAAASGLALRGVRPGDVGAVHLSGARDFALALHALTAAGAIPVPVPPGMSATDLAALLIRADARILVTGEPHTATAIEAAERSYVRQVFAFGSGSAATSFDELPAGRACSVLPVPDPLRDVALRAYDPCAEFTHADRMADVLRLAALVEPGTDDVLVACAAHCTAPTWASLVDLALLRGTTVVAVADPAPPALIRAAVEHGATIAVLDSAALCHAAHHDPAGLAALRILTTGPVPPDVPAVIMPI